MPREPWSTNVWIKMTAYKTGWQTSIWGSVFSLSCWPPSSLSHSQSDLKECLPLVFATHHHERARPHLRRLRHSFLDWDNMAHGVEKALPSPPLFLYVLNGSRYTPADIVRGLSGLCEADAGFARAVVDAARGTGVVVGLASCVERTALSDDRQASERFRYKSCYDVLNLRLMSCRGSDTFPKPFPSSQTGFTNLQDMCIVSERIARRPLEGKATAGEVCVVHRLLILTKKPLLERGKG
jgi:hypothetical protein